jgi:hypothetical protein
MVRLAARHVWGKTMKKCLILWVLFTHSVVVSSQKKVLEAGPVFGEYDRRIDCTVYKSTDELPYAMYSLRGYVIGRNKVDDDPSTETIEYGYEVANIAKWCADLSALDKFIEANKARPGRDSWGEMRPNVRQAFFRITQGVDFRILKTIDWLAAKKISFVGVDDYRELVNDIAPKVYTYCAGECMQKLMRKAYADIETTSKDIRPKISFRWIKKEFLYIDEIPKLAKEMGTAFGSKAPTGEFWSLVNKVESGYYFVILNSLKTCGQYSSYFNDLRRSVNDFIPKLNSFKGKTGVKRILLYEDDDPDISTLPSGSSSIKLLPSSSSSYSSSSSSSSSSSPSSSSASSSSSSDASISSSSVSLRSGPYFGVFNVCTSSDQPTDPEGRRPDFSEWTIAYGERSYNVQAVTDKAEALVLLRRKGVEPRQSDVDFLYDFAYTVGAECVLGNFPNGNTPTDYQALSDRLDDAYGELISNKAPGSSSSSSSGSSSSPGSDLSTERVKLTINYWHRSGVGRDQFFLDEVNGYVKKITDWAQHSFDVSKDQLDLRYYRGILETLKNNYGEGAAYYRDLKAALDLAEGRADASDDEGS